MRKTISAITCMLFSGLLVCGLAACGAAADNSDTAKKTKTVPEMTTESVNDTKTTSLDPSQELTADQYISLMSQAADKQLELRYKDYFPEKGFSAAEIFDIEKNGNQAKAYVYLNIADYTVVEGQAYETSGASGEAILYYTMTGDSVKLDKIEWAEDGTGQDQWLKDNFTKDAYKKDCAFLKEEGYDRLKSYTDDQAFEELEVSVNNDDILDIDLDAKTYEISRVEESGDPADDTYTFNATVISSGKLSK